MVDNAGTSDRMFFFQYIFATMVYKDGKSNNEYILLIFCNLSRWLITSCTSSDYLDGQKPAILIQFLSPGHFMVASAMTGTPNTTTALARFETVNLFFATVFLL